MLVQIGVINMIFSIILFNKAGISAIELGRPLNKVISMVAQPVQILGIAVALPIVFRGFLSGHHGMGSIACLVVRIAEYIPVPSRQIGIPPLCHISKVL